MTDTLYDSFLKYIRYELNLSAHTVSSYACDLGQWQRFAAENFGDAYKPADTEPNDLRLWIASLAREGIKARSVRRKVQTMRAFFKYLMKRRLMEVNPAAELATARLPKSLPTVIRPDELSNLIDSPYDQSDLTDVRNRLIITMLYSTGMRASELTGLKDANVDTIAGELKVLGKRNKERIIPFGKELSDMITLYRTLRPATDTVEFFVDSAGSALSYRKLNSIVKGELAGRVHASRRTPHVLRHSFATDMLNGGAEITAVQQLLGHASLATTQIYTHLSYKELQQNYQLAHPRAQKKE